MKDRVPLYPGRVKMVPVAGQENVYNMTRADQPTQEGTPLNKATLLKDATAALFGLGADSVPDDVLQKLAGAAFVSGGTITDVNGNQLGVQIETGSYVGTGTHGEDNPNSLTFGFEPKMVFVIGGNRRALGAFSSSALSKGMSISSFGAGIIGGLAVSWSGSTVTWYYSGSAASQLNEINSGYEYLAIG